MPKLNGSQQVFESKEYATLSKYITSHHKHLGETLDTFCEPAEDKYFNTINPSDVEGLLWKAWQSVVAVASATPHTSEERQKLANLMANLTYRPTLLKNDQICKIDDMTVWKDLPVFGWELREAWNLAASAHSDQEHKDHWINLNAWTASLVTLLHSHKQGKADYSLFGLWTIRMALEAEEQVPDVSIQAAAVWFIYGAKPIWDFSKQGKTFDGKVAAPGPSLKDREWRGFSEDRWKVWTRRLSDLKDSTSEKATSSLVEQALDAVEKVDK